MNHEPYTMNTLQVPKAPPDHLRLQCAQVLARIRLIPEFQPWLEYSRLGSSRKQETPFRLLWDCFSLGVSLCTLLDLLGSPSPSTLDITFDRSGLGLADRERSFASFIQRLQLLEVQGRLPYGEVLRTDDLFNSTSSGFAKVLRTVERVLLALQESFPGLFVLPSQSQTCRAELVQELLESERAHVTSLTAVAKSAAILSAGIPITEICLECLAVNSPRLLWYHDHVSTRLEEAVSRPETEDWEEIFAFNDNPLLIKAMGAYRSYCANYLIVEDFLEAQLCVAEPSLVIHICTVFEFLPNLLSRISEYRRVLQAILDVSLPIECPSYDSLCNVLVKIQDISEGMSEIGRQVRTMRSTQILKGRAYIWNGIDPGELGPLLLDDQIVEGVDKLQAVDQTPHYPIAPWELGPALQRSTPLNLIHAIPTTRLVALRGVDFESFELDWEDHDGFGTFVFYPTTRAQCDQWCSILQTFVPPVLTPQNFSVTPQITVDGDDDGWLSEDEEPGGRRRSHPRPWSVIARKGPTSESSSMIHQECHYYEFILSPGLLPNLFGEPRSSLSIDTTFSGMDVSNMPPTPPPESGDTILEHDWSVLLDLTGKITKDGNYPSAHGGFADVWKGTWHKGPGSCQVAVKVLRSCIDDPELEDKMQRKLRRELDVWKTLDHPHVVPLLGTASDFGYYNSMVCPWFENGSVIKYMEKYGDILSMTDRLQLLCEVAAGLSYLHSFSIVHGDLSGPNILINDSGKACLCDFGLSSIVAEFQGTSHSSTMGVGGAVRWADALLYRVHDDDYIPTATTCSDIYSFGSVMLEILSGRIPYHYIRTDAQVVIELHKGNKPRRPAETFVTDTQWRFIERCWSASLDERPHIEEVCKSIRKLHRASLDHRRYTA